MDVSNKQLEKNVSASFGYVKKDMLMLNDAFSDLHDKMQHLSMNHAALLEEMGRLRKDIAKLTGKKTTSTKATKKKIGAKTVKAKTTKKKAAKPRLAKKKETKKLDNLTKIEGIGPSIQRLLRKKDIDTYRKLGNRTPEQIRDILEKAGSKYAMHNPSTWPRQARLAAAGEWTQLGKLQEKLDGGQK